MYKNNTKWEHVIIFALKLGYLTHSVRISQKGILGFDQ